MNMGLADRYKQLSGQVPPASTSPTLAVTATESAAPATASPAPTPVAPPVPTTTAVGVSSAAPAQRRDLAALRARLAGGQTGGVNPPEGAAKLTEALTEPRTVETPSGGATPAPGFVETKAGNVQRIESTPAASPTPTGGPSTEMTRGQKAAATRAANRAAKANAAPPAPAPTTASATEDGAAPADPEFESTVVAAQAEALGHTILTETLRAQISARAVDLFLLELGLEGAIDLVRQRLPRGVKSLEVEA